MKDRVKQAHEKMEQSLKEHKERTRQVEQEFAIKEQKL